MEAIDRGAEQHEERAADNASSSELRDLEHDCGFEHNEEAAAEYAESFQLGDEKKKKEEDQVLGPVAGVVAKLVRAGGH